MGVTRDATEAMGWITDVGLVLCTGWVFFRIACLTQGEAKGGQTEQTDDTRRNANESHASVANHNGQQRSGQDERDVGEDISDVLWFIDRRYLNPSLRCDVVPSGGHTGLVKARG